MPSAAMMLSGASVGGGGGGPPSSRLLSVVGSKLWLELPIGGGWYSDAGTTLISANGASIYQWSDVSGNNRHATQTTSGNRPTIDTSVTHLGFSTTRHGGLASAKWFDLPSMSGLTEGEVFIVVRVDTDPQPGGSEGNTGLWRIGTSGQATHFPYTDSNIYDDAGSNGRRTVGNPTPSLSSQMRVYSVRSKTNDYAVYLDNSGPNTDIHGDACLLSSGTNTVGFNAAPHLGASDIATTYFLKGNIAGFAACTPVLTTAERAAAFTALTT